MGDNFYFNLQYANKIFNFLLTWLFSGRNHNNHNQDPRKATTSPSHPCSSILLGICDDMSCNYLTSRHHSKAFSNIPMEILIRKHPGHRYEFGYHLPADER